MTWDARDLVGRPIGDGLVTQTGTFQKFYEQSELAAWIEQTLSASAARRCAGHLLRVPRSRAAQQFLAIRVYTYRPRVLSTLTRCTRRIRN